MSKIYPKAVELANQFTNQYFNLPNYSYMSLEERVDYIAQFLKSVKREYRRCFLYNLYNLGGPLAVAADSVLGKQRTNSVYDNGQPAYDSKDCNEFYL